MSKSEIVDSDDELLVAYLDGELSRDERDSVENRLIDDESLRQRMQDLQRSWDMLEWLPNPVPDEKSVQTTLQLVVADINPKDASGKRLRKSDTVTVGRRRRPMTWLALAIPLVIAALAFGVTRWRQTQEIRRQIADFPVAIDMDAYAILKDGELINDLMASPRWRGVVGGSVTPDIDAMVNPMSDNSLYPRDSGETVLPDRDTLATRLQEIPSQQRIVAFSRLDRFNRLDESEKEALRRSAEQVQESESPAAMLRTMRQYVRLREQLSDEVIARIENGTGTERQLAIDDAIEEAITSIGRITGRNLSDEAIERIDYAVIQIVKDRLDSAKESGQRQAAATLFQFIKQRGRRDEDTRNAYRTFALATLLRDSNWTRWQGRFFRGGPPLENVPPLNQHELEIIESMLPTKDLDILQQYVSDPWMQSMVLRDWATESLRRKLRGESKRPSLVEQYESLPTNQREVLDLSPPEAVRKVLIEGF